MNDDLESRLRQALAEAGDGFEPLTPVAEMRDTVGRRVRSRQRLQGLAVIVFALALLGGGLATMVSRTGSSSVASLATADRSAGAHAGGASRHGGHTAAADVAAGHGWGHAGEEPGATGHGVGTQTALAAVPGHGGQTTAVPVTLHGARATPPALPEPPPADPGAPEADPDVAPPPAANDTPGPW